MNSMVEERQSGYVHLTPNGSRSKGIHISKTCWPTSRRVTRTETHNGSRELEEEETKKTMGETVSGPINGDVTDYEFVDEEMLIATVEKDGVTYKETYKFVEAERV